MLRWCELELEIAVRLEAQRPLSGFQPNLRFACDPCGTLQPSYRDGSSLLRNRWYKNEAARAIKATAISAPMR